MAQSAQSAVAVVRRTKELSNLQFALLLALSLGAQGGVYIAGGIVPRLGARFAESGFRARFEAKGRLSAYLAAIPTYVVTHPLPAFLGCAAKLAEG